MAKEDDTKLDLIIIGSRGIPAKYGGFETFAEELSVRLAARGWRVAVACEHEEGAQSTFQGVELLHFPRPPPRNYALRKFYEMANDVYFLVRHGRRAKRLYVLAVTANFFLFVPRVLNRRSAYWINVDGLEWRRSKFSRLEKFLLRTAHHLGIRAAKTVILDAKALKEHVPPSQSSKTRYIPYGVDPFALISWDEARLAKTHTELRGLRPNEYWLVVARLEPENNIEVIVRGAAEAVDGKPLVIVGNATDSQFNASLRQIARSSKRKIVFTGGIYDRDTLNMLRQNAFGYLHGHSVGGTNPSLLEAMMMSNLILAHENPFNREVLANAGLFFEHTSDIARMLEAIERDPSSTKKLRDDANARAKETYSWERVIRDYEALMGLRG